MNKSTTDTPRTDSWECFSDPSYYDMARLRRTDGPKDFNTGYHLNNLREAVEVRDILNELERRADKIGAKVERLKKMVIEAAELGDKRSENFKAMAEKAEASLIKINEELCQAGLREYGN